MAKAFIPNITTEKIITLTSRDQDKLQLVDTMLEALPASLD